MFASSEHQWRGSGVFTRQLPSPRAFVGVGIAADDVAGGRRHFPGVQVPRDKLVPQARVGVRVRLEHREAQVWWAESEVCVHGCGNA